MKHDATIAWYVVVTITLKNHYVISSIHTNEPTSFGPRGAWAWHCCWHLPTSRTSQNFCHSPWNFWRLSTSMRTSLLLGRLLFNLVDFSSTRHRCLQTHVVTGTPLSKHQLSCHRHLRVLFLMFQVRSGSSSCSGRLGTPSRVWAPNVQHSLSLINTFNNRQTTKNFLAFRRTEPHWIY